MMMMIFIFFTVATHTNRIANEHSVRLLRLHVYSLKFGI